MEDRRRCGVDRDPELRARVRAADFLEEFRPAGEAGADHEEEQELADAAGSAKRYAHRMDRRVNGVVGEHRPENEDLSRERRDERDPNSFGRQTKLPAAPEALDQIKPADDDHSHSSGSRTGIQLGDAGKRRGGGSANQQGNHYDTKSTHGGLLSFLDLRGGYHSSVAR